jgi:uncharacterized protein YbjT (DUF2867 family)
MSYTILRPPFFLDNLQPGFFGRVVATAWRDQVGNKRPMQAIAVEDIGYFGAEALMRSDSPEYKNKALSIAGDELTWEQAEEIFKEETGRPIPVTFAFVTALLLWAVKDVGLMFKFFREDHNPFGADIAKTRALDPHVKDFRTWVRSSGHSKKTA